MSKNVAIRSLMSRWAKNRTGSIFARKTTPLFTCSAAAAIHKVDPKMKLGGPVFEGVDADINVWPDAQGRTSWSGRFVDYLRTHGRLADLAFWSFEHYPYEPCEITWTDLIQNRRG